MKRSTIPMAMLAAGALAQEITTTITFSVCPTATTTTITLPTTITFCPGGFCNVTPTGGIPGATVTTTATTTSYITVYKAPCPNKKGMCDASYTIWEECPCTEHGKGYIPKDFTTTLHKCDSCGEHGEPTEYTRTLPCTTGAYATQTPTYGEEWHDGPHPEIPIENDKAVAPAYGGKPGAPVADAQAGGKGAAPVADAQAGGKGGAPVADAQAGGKGGAPVADAQAGGKGAAPVADAQAAGKGAAPVADAQAGGKGGAPVADAQAGGKGGAPVANAEAGGKDGKGVADYTGSANKAAFALSTVFAGVVGALAMML